MVVAALAAAVAGWLATPGPRAARRLPRAPAPAADQVAGGAGPEPRPSTTLSAAPRGSGLTGWLRAPLLAAAAAGVLVTRVVHGPVGWVAGLVVAVGFVRWFSSLEGARARRRHEQLVRELPVVVDLLGACLRAGRAVSDSLDVVADAWRGPVSGELRAVSAQLALGGDPVTVWQTWAADPALEPLARAFARAGRSGASVTATLQHAAADLRQRRRWAGRAQAQSVGVRTAAPLGLCFMPAFVVLGIVPTVIGTLSSTAVL